jgi:transposase
MASTPPYKSTDEARIKVTALKSFGITNEEIATHIGISVDTLNRYYQRELDTAIIDANAKVAGKLFKKATEDEDLGAQIFWLKTRGRWRTEDSKVLADSNDELKAELKALREKLDAQNKREY